MRNIYIDGGGETNLLDNRTKRSAIANNAKFNLAKNRAEKLIALSKKLNEWNGANGDAKPIGVLKDILRQARGFMETAKYAAKKVQT